MEAIINANDSIVFDKNAELEKASKLLCEMAIHNATEEELKQVISYTTTIFAANKALNAWKTALDKCQIVYFTNKYTFPHSDMDEK